MLLLSVFVGWMSVVMVYGLNFLSGRDAACADCNVNGVVMMWCVFGDVRDNGVVSVFDGLDVSVFECVVNVVDGATGTSRLGFARGSWSANGGYDWVVFGGESGGGGDGSVYFMKILSVDDVIVSVVLMGMLTYATGGDFARGAFGCYFEFRNDVGLWVMWVMGMVVEVVEYRGLFVSFVLY